MNTSNSGSVSGSVWDRMTVAERRRLVRNFIVVTIGIPCAWFAFSFAESFLLRMNLQSMCDHQLRVIGVALQSYHTDYGCYPPAYTTDSQGRPMHSWRVLLLPYLEDPPLCAGYDLSQPWNSKANLLFAAQMPQSFRCPGADPGTLDYVMYTSYVANITPRGLFRTNGVVRAPDIKNTAASTIAVLEVEDSRVSWLDPLDGKGQSDAYALPPTQPRHQNHRGRLNALFADGKVRALPDTTYEKTLNEAQSVCSCAPTH